MAAAHKPTILIVSADTKMVQALGGLFNRDKYFPAHETTPYHALQTANLLKPALIIFNLEPHRAEHIELCHRLRSTTEGAILLLAPSEESSHTFEYYQAGIVNEHIPTPVNPLALWVRCMVWLAKYEYMTRRLGSTLIYA
jgi:DNA-binding response OmpR family regulator